MLKPRTLPEYLILVRVPACEFFVGEILRGRGKGREVGAGVRSRSMARARLRGRDKSSDGRQSHDLSKEYCAELVCSKGGKEPAF